MIKLTVRSKKLFILVLFLLCCEGKKDNEGVVLARVGKKKLFFKDLPSRFNSPNIKSTDISVFVNNWVNDEVLFSSAKREGLLNDKMLKEKTEAYYKDLVVSSFVKTKTNVVNKITKEHVLFYYNDNKLSFVRKRDGVFARHFISKDIEFAKKIKNQISKTKKSINIDKHLNDSNYIEKGFLSKDIDKLLFSSNQSVVGPVFYNQKHHVFEIVYRYKKGSFFGLEDVHDEIYQRLIKKNYVNGTSELLDSLKRRNDVFINLNY